MHCNISRKKLHDTELVAWVEKVGKWSIFYSVSIGSLSLDGPYQFDMRRGFRWVMPNPLFSIGEGGGRCGGKWLWLDAPTHFMVSYVLDTQNTLSGFLHFLLPLMQKLPSQIYNEKFSFSIIYVVCLCSLECYYTVDQPMK